MAYSRQVKSNTRENLSIQVLAYVCKTVNRVNIKQLNSFKHTKEFIRSMGYSDIDVEYVTSYCHNNSLIDLFKALQGRMLVYSTKDCIIGFKVKNPPYAFKRYVVEKLQCFSLLETGKNIICERKY